MKKILVLLAICASVNLTACAGLPFELQKPEGKPKQEAVQTTSETTAELPASSEAAETESSEQADSEESADDIDMDTALFRSTASTAQMEITTGLTTEYLSYLCNFPVRVVKGDQETILKDEGDLEKMGLDSLYTDELLTAVKEFDTDKLEIQDGTTIVGDLGTAYIVLGKDQNDIVGITEFHYEK